MAVTNPYSVNKHGWNFKFDTSKVTPAEISDIADTITPKQLPDGFKFLGKASPDAPYTLAPELGEETIYNAHDEANIYSDSAADVHKATVTIITVSADTLDDYTGGSYNPETKLYSVPATRKLVQTGFLAVWWDGSGRRLFNAAFNTTIKAGEAVVMPIDGVLGFPLALNYRNDDSDSPYHWGGELIRASREGLPAPRSAAATVNIDDIDGSIESFTVTDGGTGYTTAPEVVIDGDGTGATATATVSNGAVAAVTVVNPGIDYLNATVAFVR